MNNRNQVIDLMALRQKFSILFLLLYWFKFSLSACVSNCKTCTQQDVYIFSPYCTSCDPGYYLSGYNCKNCSFCSSCDQCSSPNHTTTIIIILGITVPLICFIVLCCVKMMKKRITRQVVQVPNNSQPICSAINLMPNLQPISNIWKRSTYKLDSKENCKICIQDNALLETKCNHYFHPKCIDEWAARKKSCPLCDSPNLTILKLYCKKCKQSYVQVNLAMIRNLTQSGKWDNCSTCQNGYF